EGSMDAVIELTRKDPVRAYLDPLVRQAAEEFPAALSELRERLPVDNGPIAVVGGSLGGMVVLRILARPRIPIEAAALVNPAVRARSVVGLVTDITGRPYPWDAESREAADRLDFVARAGDIAARAPHLRCWCSAANWTSWRCAQTRPSWSMHYASGTHSPTTSGSRRWPTWPTRWPSRLVCSPLRSSPWPRR
ncbi:MAG: alpha/beta hydrolase family protein, partial [Pseudonocardiaceae bacterium]